MLTPKELRSRIDYLVFKCNLSKEESERLFSKFFKYLEDPVVVSAVSIIHDNKENYSLLQDILTNTLTKEINDFYKSQTKPLITINPKSSTELLVFPNILLEGNNDITSLNSFNCTNALKTFITEYEIDKDGPGAQKWKNNERIEKRLGTVLSLGTATVLTRYCNFKNKYKDSQIRDIANKIDDARKPLEVNFAETPEELADMYATGPSSCMAGNRDSWTMLTEKGLGPSSFYAYFPHTKGAYIKKNGKIVARTILYTDNGDTWRFGRIYANTPEYHEKLIETLRSHNIIPLTGKFIPPKGSSFKMPGVKYYDEYYAPMPYLDDINYNGKGFYGEFDDVNKEFTISFEPNAELNIISVVLRDGVIKASDYKKSIKVKCYACNREINSKNALMSHGGDHYFCNDHCMNQKGYFKVYTINGENQILPDRPEFLRVLDAPTVRIASEAAGRQAGYCVYCRDIGMTAEEGEPLAANKFAGIDNSNRRIGWDGGPTKIQTVPIGQHILHRNVEFEYGEDELSF